MINNNSDDSDCAMHHPLSADHRQKQKAKKLKVVTYSSLHRGMVEVDKTDDRKSRCIRTTNNH